MCHQCRARDLRINARQVLNRVALRLLTGQERVASCYFTIGLALGPIVAAEQFDPTPKEARS